MTGRPIGRLVCPELVGRDSEIATIGELAGTVAAGGAATVLLSGEAGFGKSALLARAIEIGRRAGLRALRADCMRLEMARAFGPFVDVLGAMKAPPGSVAEALELAPAPSRLRAPGGMDDRYRAHHAFARAFAALADERPVMVAVDDLHWADESSLELFAHLSRRLGKGILLIGTYRSEEIHDRPALSRALADTRRERTWELALHRLTASDVGRALRLILGPSARVSRRSRETLQASSAGNPLFLEEMLRALAQRGELERKDGVWSLGDISRLPLPRSVEEAVTERWATLKPHTREVLVFAAVIGERFRLDLLRAASGVDETDLLAAVRTAVGAQLVVEDTSGGDAFAFRHALIREAILGQLLARERRILHLKVASALEAAPGDDEAASVLAYHFDAAGEAHRARGYHERAGERDGRRGAATEAIAHYERAIELASDDDRSVAELSMRIALLGTRVLPRQLSAIQEAIRRYERVDEPRALANALLWLQTWIRNWLCWPWSRSVGICDRVAVLVAPFGDTPELAWLRTASAREALERGDPDRALELGLEGLAIADRAGASWHQAVAHRSAAHALWTRGDIDESIAHLRCATAIVSDSPDSRMGIGTVEDLLDALRLAGGDAEEISALVARVKALHDRYGTAESDIVRLHHVLYAADWDELVGLYDQRADDSDELIDTNHAALHRAFVEVARTGPQGLPLAMDANTKLSRRGDATEPGTATIAEVAIVAEQPQIALAALEPAAPFVARPRAFKFYLVPAAIYGLIAASAAQDEGAAARWIERATWSDLRPPLTWSAVLLNTQRYVEAERLWRSGERDAAIAALAAVLEQRRTGDMAGQNPVLTHLISLRYAELLAGRGGAGDREVATAELASVVTFYRKAGATWYLSRLRDRANELGISFPQAAAARAPTSPLLTLREREIATLVAEGLTNKQIAERLTLSVRTAESHVERIRAKLGFHTRAQIAAWATETYGRAS